MDEDSITLEESQIMQLNKGDEAQIEKTDEMKYHNECVIFSKVFL